MSKAGSNNKIQCEDSNTALYSNNKIQCESQGASHRRKAEGHTGMKSAYSDSWSLYEFMDSRAEKWMSTD